MSLKSTLVQVIVAPVFVMVRCVPTVFDATNKRWAAELPVRVSMLVTVMFVAKLNA
jgi:hypothetical protein